MNQSDLPVASLPASPADGAKPLRVAFIQASWHADIVGRAREGFLAEIARLGVPVDPVTVIDVPGAYEIPLHAATLAKSSRFDAIVACGLVVDGGIYRHDFVSTAVIDGLMRVQLDTEVPVFSCVLTPHHFHEHVEHRKYFHNHFAVKGTEAAEACVKTIEGLQRLDAILTA